MRHGMRRSIKNIVLAVITFSMWGGAIAEAGPLDASLRGDYSMTATRTCNDAAQTILFTIVVRGTSTFDGSGGGSFNGQSLAITPQTAQANQSCTVIYTVNADGTFTQQMNCNLTFSAGPDAGNTATLNGIQIQGQLSLDGTVILLSDTAINVETFTWTSGPNNGIVSTRECNTSGSATSRR